MTAAKSGGPSVPCVRHCSLMLTRRADYQSTPQLCLSRWVPMNPPRNHATILEGPEAAGEVATTTDTTSAELVVPTPTNWSIIARNRLLQEAWFCCEPTIAIARIDRSRCRAKSALKGASVYYIWGLLLVLANLTAWLSNAVALPGNWLILACTALFAWVFPKVPGPGISWTTVGILVAIAVFGELLEFLAGAAVAGQRGGSRRGMALAIVGTVVGSFGGAFVSLPVPLVGPVIGALVGGAIGAFVGAWSGEIWKGRSWREGLDVGKGAVLGRLLGTAGKLVLGALMVAIAAVDTFF